MPIPVVHIESQSKVHDEGAKNSRIFRVPPRTPDLDVVS
jgi:hypothetical protein